MLPIVYSSLQKLSLVNGVLFTGGSAKRGLYFETIKKVFQVRCVIMNTVRNWYNQYIRNTWVTIRCYVLFSSNDVINSIRTSHSSITTSDLTMLNAPAWTILNKIIMTYSNRSSFIMLTRMTRVNNFLYLPNVLALSL